MKENDYGGAENWKIKLPQHQQPPKENIKLPRRHKGFRHKTLYNEASCL